MKLIIDSVLHIPKAYMDRDLASSILKKFSITYTETEDLFIISEQKCVLDEANMNELFYEVIEYLIRYEIDYIGLGGAGCEFCLVIREV